MTDTNTTKLKQLLKESCEEGQIYAGNHKRVVENLFLKIKDDAALLRQLVGDENIKIFVRAHVLSHSEFFAPFSNPKEPTKEEKLHKDLSALGAALA